MYVSGTDFIFLTVTENLYKFKGNIIKPHPDFSGCGFSHVLINFLNVEINELILFSVFV